MVGLFRGSTVDAWKLLQELAGVGPKVADCVCLMGLGHLEAVPVDTHVLRVTARDYGLEVPRSLTTKSYCLIGGSRYSTIAAQAAWHLKTSCLVIINRGLSFSSMKYCLLTVQVFILLQWNLRERTLRERDDLSVKDTLRS